MSLFTDIPHVTLDHRGSAGWCVFEGRVRLVCGGCGRDIGDLRHHTVEADGRVHASILCPYPRCGWHVFGRLLGWTHGQKTPFALVQP